MSMEVILGLYLPLPFLVRPCLSSSQLPQREWLPLPIVPALMPHPVSDLDLPKQAPLSFKLVTSGILLWYQEGRLT